MERTRFFDRHAAITLWAAFSLCLTACTDDPFISKDIYADADGFTLTLQADPMEKLKVTRASDNKTDAEKAINRLDLFFFDSTTGQFLTEYQGRFIGWQTFQQQSIVKVDRNAIRENGHSAVTVYALANFVPETFSDLNGNDIPDDFESDGSRTPLQIVQQYTYSPENGVNLRLPDGGMPMIGHAEIDFSGTTNNQIIAMEALMARVDVSIQLDSEITQNNFPAMRLVDWTVLNVPRKVPLSEPAAGEWTGDFARAELDTILSNYTGNAIYNRNGSISFSFYLFENVQEPAQTSYDYPQTITEAERQRYKPLLADTENATALQLHAYYSTYNESGTGSSTYKVRYTLYLGANHTNDFTVRRNHQYKNDITIVGLTQAQDQNPEHITFDARVNITSDNNKYYIAMLREQNHDAHFCVTPMDVYLFADESLSPTMDVILTEGANDHEEQPWIRMERITSEQMAAGSAPNTTDYITYPGQAYHAGNGKRKYFTCNLVTQTLANNTQITGVGNRDRIYFYLDENLNPALEDREATVTLIYKENGVEQNRRTLLIRQTHLVPVTRVAYDGESTPNPSIIYMEAYEEYLEHYDPLNEFTTGQIYSGLEWAPTLYGIEILDINGENDFTDNYRSGWAYTSYIAGRYLGMPGITLDSELTSAFQYCSNRNKRSSDGTLPREYTVNTGWFGETSVDIDYRLTKWFLPGIRDMENALTEYYPVYPEFQGNFYWSSASGQRNAGLWPPIWVQDENYARGTKVVDPDASNRDDRYAHSGANDNYTDNNGTLGKASRRDVEMRIRAFRIDLERANY